MKLKNVFGVKSVTSFKKPALNGDIVDVESRTPRRALRAAIALTVVFISVLVAWVWQGPYQSWRDRQVIEEAITLQSTLGPTSMSRSRLAHLHQQFEQTRRNSRPVELHLLAELFSDFGDENEANKSVFQVASAAALREAARQGSELAKLDLAVAKRNSAPSDFSDVLRTIDDVSVRVQQGVRAGDPVSMYTLAVMKTRGIGAEVDRRGAIDLAKRAGNNLPPGYMAELAGSAAFGTGIFSEQTDTKFAQLLGRRLLEMKYFPIPYLCDPPTIENLDAAESIADCQSKHVRESAFAGDPLSFASYAEQLVEEGAAVSEALTWYRKASPQVMSDSTLAFYLIVEVSMQGSITPTAREITTIINSSNDWSIAPDELLTQHMVRYIGEKIAHLETSPEISQRGLVKAMAIYRGLIDRINSTNVVLFNNHSGKSPKWVSIFKSPIVTEMSANLTAALKTGAGLDNAFSQIDAMGATATDYQPSRTPPKIDKDPDFRSNSGEISKPLGPQGLSTFTVDNNKGDSDVVVRLYRDGNLPAVRSFVVKQGQTYTSEKIAAGNYVMRHRGIGTTKTFEANEVFVLSETRTEDGVRYSKVKVTMYKVQNGNLSSKEVPPDRF